MDVVGARRAYARSSRLSEKGLKLVPLASERLVNCNLVRLHVSREMRGTKYMARKLS